MHPLIAIPSRLTATADTWRVPATAVGRPYLEALVRAGAIPISVPPLLPGDAVDELLGRVDGLCLPGGPDVDPARYGAPARHPSVTGVDARHDELDLALAAGAVAAGLPVLAICRGHQVLNVALGGRLHQHLDDVVGADAAATHLRQVHPVALIAGSRVAEAMGTSAPSCHCVHHQAVERVGRGLAVAGRRGGVVEAVESTDAGNWVIGVQWHPEDTAAHDPRQQALFDAFVRAAGERGSPLAPRSLEGQPPRMRGDHLVDRVGSP